ncbi:MAG: hypothetical protein ACKO0Z_06295 [Betaproteobacteria bacterium]
MPRFDDLEIDREDLRNYRVRVVIDDEQRDIGDAINDEPIAVYRLDYRHDWTSDELIDQTKLSCADGLLARAIEERDLERLLDYYSGSYWEVTKTPTKRYMLTGGGFIRPRLYKSEENVFNAILNQEGVNWRDVRTARIDTRDTAYFCMWSQSELDAYAGVKNAKPCTDTIRDWIDGNIYGFIIDEIDDEGDVIEDHVESVWGFYGDSDYCMSEGLSAAKWLQSKKDSEHAEALACEIAASRPDLAPCYMEG